MIYHSRGDLEVALNNKGADGRMRSIPKVSARKIQRGGAGRFEERNEGYCQIYCVYSSKSKRLPFLMGDR